MPSPLIAPTDIGKVAKVFKTPIPKTFNKFHKLNINLVDLLANNHLKCSTKKELNDPYDLNITLSSDSLKKQWSSEHLRFYYDILLRQKPKEIKSILPLDEIRVSCFCAYRYSLSMWAHYGDNFKGVCLQFDKDLYPLENGVLVPVLYGRRKTKIESEEEYFLYHFSKLNSWSNEKEWRILSFNEYVPFEKSKLKKIVFGYNVKPYQIQLIKKVVEENGYTCKLKRKVMIENRLREIDV